MQQKEITAGLEIKSLDEGGGFEGYASVFGVQDSDGDVIVKGAFTETLKGYRESGKMPKMLWQHDRKEIIGKYTEMEEDDNGLWVKGNLIMETQRGREAYALMKAGVLDSMSVGFNITEAGDGEMRGSGRVIEAVDLWEVSLVTWGANPDAQITSVKSIKDFERFLRDAGYTRKQALAIASGGYKAAFEQSDSAPEDEEETKTDPETVEAVKQLKNTIQEAANG